MKRILLLAIIILVNIRVIGKTDHIEVGIDEKLNNYLPKDAVFTTSDGKQVSINDIITKPTILSLVYYECPGICSPLLSELSHTIDKIDLVPGVDYNIVTLSFNDKENYIIAAKWKNTYLKGMNKKIDPNSWIFLTGDSLNIKKLTDAVGFYFKPYDKDYVHAAALIAISPNRKITRYIFGTQYNQFDVKMALIEAKAGRSNPTITKVLEFCYSYNPSGRNYQLNITRIIGVIMLIGLAGFVAFVVLRKKNKGENINE